jgi:hypothetical protein
MDPARLEKLAFAALVLTAAAALYLVFGWHPH